MSHKVLVIEDNADIAELVRLHLADIDCEVRLAADGDTGFEAARAGPYDLIILDLMLPGIDGLELCGRLRGECNYTPILMLTSKSAEADRVRGLEMGADDYVTKPFSIRELLARVKAMLRRADGFGDGRAIRPEQIRAGDMAIDVDKRAVTIAGECVDLTAREFDLLLHFARHPGRVFTREQLLDLVWGHSHMGYEHTVNSHINRLRAKIEAEPSAPRYVLTVWGVGYKFNDDLGRQ